jgi:GNAT superfamily N-acetyltransferase
MQISTATPADIPDLCKLLAILFAQEAEFDVDVAAQQRGLASIIGDPSMGRILIARDGGMAVGMVNLLFTVSTALGERVALLEDMVVTTHARGAGVGSQLMTQAIATARAAGCRRITVLSDRDNGAAHRFYQRHGFTLSTMVPLRLALIE